MKIEKLPSGSYRIRKMYKGKVYSVVTEYKPTQKEAIKLLADEMDKVSERKSRMTFEDAANEYIDSKRNILSPTTIRCYKSTLRSISAPFKEKNVHDIEPMDVQKEANLVAKEKSPKTVRNFNAFITAVLGVYRPNMRIRTTMPQKSANEPYIPSDDDVRRLLERARGTEFEIPIILACHGLRRSEICALEASDVNGDLVTVSKAKVDGEDGWVIKSTKNVSSTRVVAIPPEIAERIREQGYVYRGNPNTISGFMAKAEKELGIEKFSLHKLRHYFATKMSAAGIPEENIMKMGGWQTDGVMKKVYRHAIADRDNQIKREAAETLKKAILPCQNP